MFIGCFGVYMRAADCMRLMDEGVMIDLCLLGFNEISFPSPCYMLKDLLLL